MTTQSQKFWDFSVRLYAQPRVAESCLELQDIFGIDVNLLLFCYWHGLYFGRIPDQTLQQAFEFSKLWRAEVVQPLRNVRQWMKQYHSKNEVSDAQDFLQLRERIKAVELNAENHQQNTLQKLVMEDEPYKPNMAGSMECCEYNIGKLLTIAGLATSDEITRRTAIISEGLDLLG